MKVNISYISSLVLWTLYAIDNSISHAIGYPIKKVYVFLYNHCSFVKKQLEKQGFKSSKDIDDNYIPYAENMNPYRSFFVEMHIMVLYFFFINGCIISISNGLLNYDIPRIIPTPYDWYALLFVVIVSAILCCYFVFHKDRFKSYFNHFDKWDKNKRLKMRWLGFGIVLFCWVFHWSAVIIFLSDKN